MMERINVRDLEKGIIPMEEMTTSSGAITAEIYPTCEHDNMLPSCKPLTLDFA